MGGEKVRVEGKGEEKILWLRGSEEMRLRLRGSEEMRLGLRGSEERRLNVSGDGNGGQCMRCRPPVSPLKTRRHSAQVSHCQPCVAPSKDEKQYLILGSVVSKLGGGSRFSSPVQ
ncbi:hypothetical protein Pmani_027334 [Petrolisthes manimaculis]|uniref:Uncharacterized protein n=1 Tax=Petrolisthes manimaculis TaxID=1843537 RepID=A0AAE1P1M1_9EUCA|nr:hypothetical protein Pmani_027334 [Petrolisthes manimaculis]